MAEIVLCERYRLIKEVGEGSHSVVFKAWDIQERRNVAVKRLKTDGLPEDEALEVRELFFREINILKKLTHESIPRAYDFLVHEDQYYFVMEWVGGEDLLSRFGRKGKLSEKEACDYLNRLADTMIYLQKESLSLVHKDIKPSNIILCSMNKIKMLDFGIARHHSPDKERDTHELGTPGYAAPEAYMGIQTDMSSDIYSLGATFYHLVTGEEPLQFNFNFPSPKQFNPDLSEEFSQILLDCLKSRKTRIKDAKELQGRLFDYRHKTYKAILNGIIMFYVALSILAMAPDMVGALATTACSMGAPTYYSAIQTVYYTFIFVSSVMVIIAFAGKIRGKYLLKFVLVLILVFYIQTAYTVSRNIWRVISSDHFENSRSIQEAILKFTSDHNGKYPDSLNALVPEYLASIPKCPLTGKDDYEKIYLMCRNRSNFYNMSMKYTGKEAFKVLHTSSTELGYCKSVMGYTKCKENLKKIHTALEEFKNRTGGKYPKSLGEMAGLTIDELPVCPLSGMEMYGFSYKTDEKRENYTIYCIGYHHAGLGVEENYPQYSSINGLMRSKSYEKCRKNVRDISIALKQYASENGGRYPGRLSLLVPGYLPVIPRCPHLGADTNSLAYRTDRNRVSFKVYCKGSQHEKLGVAKDFPMETSHNERAEEDLAACSENLYEIYFKLFQYCKNDDICRFPEKLEDLVPDYLPSIPHCPGGGKDTYSDSYFTYRERTRFTYYCKGHNHLRAGVAKDFPFIAFRKKLTTKYIKDKDYEKCSRNLKEIHLAINRYRSGHHGNFPKSLRELVPGYLKAIPVCPVAGVDTYSDSYTIDKKRNGAILFCSGYNHSKKGYAENHPVSEYYGEGNLSDLRAVCCSNCYGISLALDKYAAQHDGKYPENLKSLVPEYLKEIPKCPAVEDDTYSRSYSVDEGSCFYTFYCEGANHLGPGYDEDYPLCSFWEGVVERKR